MDSDMEEYRVHDLPHGLYYITNFLSPEEEQSLLDKVGLSHTIQTRLIWSRSRQNDGQSCRTDDWSHIPLLWQRAML